MKSAFIISTGRTGTGFFTGLVNRACPNAWSEHEPAPAFRRRARRLLYRPDTWWDRFRFARPRRRRMRERGLDWYIESNFQLFACVPMLRRCFPGTRIVLVVRDGRDVATSYLNRGRYIEHEHIRPAPNDPAAAQWADWSPVQKNAWYWSTVNRHARARAPDSTWRFEDLFDPEQDTLFRFLEQFEGLEFDRDEVERLRRERVNTNRTESWPAWAGWEPAWQEQFLEIAGETLSEFGYGDD